MCHKFDTIVFPGETKSSSTGFFQKLTTRLSRWTGISDTKDTDQRAASKPLTAVELADSCFQVYFSAYESIITTGSFHRDTNIVYIAQTIAQLYSCLVHQKFLDRSYGVVECKNREILQVSVCTTSKLSSVSCK